MSKSRLFSGKIKKLSSGKLTADRYEYLDASQAEPDLGAPVRNGSVLTGSTTSNVRNWNDILTVDGATVRIWSTLTNIGFYTPNALVVDGGIGVAGDINILGKALINNVEVLTTQSGLTSQFGQSIINLTLRITTSTNSTGTSSGSLVVYGGVGINKDLYVGGTTYAGNIYSNGSLVGSSTGTTSTFLVNNATISTNTSSGALQVVGGVGIGGALFVNTTSYIAGSQIITTATVNNYASKTVITAGTDTAINTSTGNVTIWNTSTLQTITNRGNSTTNILLVTNTASSTLTTNGALVVSGGIGVGGNINVGGVLFVNTTSYIAGSQIITTATINDYADKTFIYAGTDTAVNTSTGNITIWNTSNLQTITNRGNSTTNAIIITNTAISHGPTDGALVVGGGVGVFGEIYAGGDIFTNGQKVITTSTVNDYADKTFIYAGTDTAVNTSTGNITIWNTSTLQTITDRGNSTTNIVLITNTTSSTSTTTGALVISGGVGISKDLYIDGNLKLGAGSTLSIGTQTIARTVITAGTDTAVNTSTGNITIWNTSTLQSITNRGNSTNNIILITNTSTSTTSNSGALVVTGGVGIGENLYVGNKLAVLNTLSSTSSIYQNAAYIEGGLGVGKSLYVTGEAIFQNNVTFLGTTTYVLTTNTVYTDNLLELHYPSNPDHLWTVDDGLDIGFRFHYYKDGDKNAGLVLSSDNKYLEWYSSGNEDTTSSFTGSTFGTFKTGNIILTNTTTSTSTNTGALIVSGGVGISENLYVGNAIYENGRRVVTTASINQYANQTAIYAGTDTAVNTSTGNITIWNTSTLQSVTNRGSSTTNAILIANTSYALGTQTGALVVTGGVGIGGDLHIAGQIFGANGQSINANNAGTTSTFFINNTTTSTSTNSGALTVTGGVGIGGDLRIGGQIFGANGQSINASNSGTTSTFFINNSTTSTSTITGALTVVGGVGIGKDLYVGGQIFGPDGQAINAHNTGTTSTFLISSTASSTSTSTGALTVKGGAGIGENLFVGGNISVYGQISLNGQVLGLGFNGSTGFTGSRGFTGSVGFTGSFGYTGSASTASGYIGSTGYTGSVGPQGASVNILGSTSTFTALPGYPSSYVGARGDAYVTSDTGNLWIWSGSSWSNAGKIVGPQGNPGFVGSSGYAGSASTASGYTGSQGIPGAYAALGYTGSQGNLGDKGDPGDLGFTGSFGYTGSASTASGYTGSEGYTGSTGTQGVSGFTGSQGIQGEPGTATFRGYTGSQSTATGYTGSQGYFGSKGGFNSIQTISTQTGTSYSLALIDAGSLINFTNDIGTQVTILPDNLINFDVGQRIDIGQGGLGAVVVSAFLGVILHSTDATVLTNQYSIGTLIKVGPNEWTFAGPATSVAGYQGSMGYTGSASTQTGFTGSKGGFDSVQVINTQTGTSYSLVLSDAGRLIEFSNDANTTVTILPDNIVNFSVGQRIDVCKIGGGFVSVAAYLGVTLFSTESPILTTMYSVGTLIKIGENQWTFFGPATASTGPIGYVGSQGITGYWGSFGYTGSTGTQGVIGFTGSGSTATGYSGSLGYTGSRSTASGFTGSLGYTGSTGTQGVIGFTGSQGITGYWGSFGYTGSQGDIGYTGSIGFTGSQGITGYWGSFGYTGSTGTQGVIGYTGSQGYSGSTGYSGSFGYTGSTGTQGVIGFTGSGSTATGYSGSLGYTGSEGNPGSSITIIGAVSTSTSLPGWQYSYTGSKGDGYVTTVDGFLWIWNGTQWNSIVKITGPQGFRGYTGSQGADGAAVDRGYTGSASFDGSIQVIITNTSSSTSTTTGALVVSGGVGIGKDLYVGGTVTATNYYGNITTLNITTYPVGSNANLLIDPDGSGDVIFSTATQILVLDTATSTSTTTGALVVSGGIGVVKDLYVGGTIYQKGIAVSTGTGSGTGLASGNITMFQSGYLTVTQGTQRWYAPYNLNITSIKTKLGTAGSNANVITVNKNAAPIVTITISGAATSGTTYTTPLSMNEDDYLTVDVAPVLPQTTTATNLYVQFKYQAV